MPDRFVFDLQADYPDVVIDTMRRAVLEQIDGLREAVAQLEVHSDQLDAALLLCTTAFDFADTMLAAVLPLQQALAAQEEQLVGQQQALEKLTARVTDLESPPDPAPDPTTGGAA